MDITITGTDIGTTLSVTSLILAIVFWKLSSVQAKRALRQAELTKETLKQIDEKMNSWQQKINDSTIKLIEARPEIIAQQVSMEEAKNNSDFMRRIADTIEKLSNEANEDSTGYKIAIVKQLLEHQKSSILASEKIKANVILAQQGAKS